MKTARRVYKNTLYLGSAEIISKALQFVVMLYAARELTQHEFGAFNFALALSFIATILADMGVNMLLVRSVARDKALLDKYVVNALFLKSIFSVGAFLLVWMALLALGYGGQTLDVALIMLLFAILSSFTDFIYSIFRAFERMEFDSFLKIVRMVLLAAFSLGVLIKGLGVVAFSLMFLVVECMVILIGFIIISKKFVTKRLRLSWLDSGYREKIRKDAFPFGLSAMFGGLYFYASVLILSFLRGELEVAKFSSAYNIALALLFIPTVYTNALYPVLSRFFVESKRKLTLAFEKSLKYLFIASLPISVCFLLLSEKIMGLLYGSKYVDASIVLQIIGCYIILKFANFLFGMVLSSADRQWERMKAQGMVASINLLLCAVLIWEWGFIGAAWAMLISEIALIVVYAYQVRRVILSKISLLSVARPLACTLIFSLCVLFLPFHYMISAAFGGLFYVVALFITGVFDEEDKEIMRDVFLNGKI